ncbi:DNA recombination protein RmuC [Azospirillum brasilense]|uniref:DNA recombination protein RmuC homolog n=1 Tax=Azospirillum brasilense TaxID=192 RepID=A0A560BFG6_AZOBR|nr:DNA recombination protein RmuC [Azospirillum brasilense]TWA71375.1 DNA recombination protein RmuC [Azospirillum brasilense]
MQFAFDAQSVALGGLAGALLGAILAGMIVRLYAARAEAEAAAIHAELVTRLDVAERIEGDVREEVEARDHQIARLTGELSAARERQAELSTTLARERASSAEKLALLERAQATLSDSFKALSAEALRSNNQSFLDLAKETLTTFQEQARGDLEKRQTAIADIVAPVRQSLERMDGQIQEMERSRAGAYEGLKQQVLSLVETQSQLRTETGNLVRALRSPVARGRWGEIQLRRVCEMAGMLDHCDFAEQMSVEAAGGRLRPDLVVKLPGGKTIVVDAKTPLEGYLDGVQAADDGARRDGLSRHARHVREHMKQLGTKAYWDQFADSPEFVVLFLPGENFFSAALEHDPALIEAGIDHRVILATPTTLIALLRAVAYGWRQERLTDSAREISALGAELYKRLHDLGGHMERLGGQLEKAVGSYNGAVGSLESRVLVTARRFRDLHATPDSAEEIPLLEPLDHAPRPLQAPELRAAEPRAAELRATELRAAELRAAARA